MAAVREAPRRRDAAVALWNDRERFEGHFGGRDVAAVEAALERVARDVGAVLVVRTWEAVSPTDRARYAAVIVLADGRTWRGAPADPP